MGLRSFVFIAAALLAVAVANDDPAPAPSPAAAAAVTAPTADAVSTGPATAAAAAEESIAAVKDTDKLMKMYEAVKDRISTIGDRERHQIETYAAEAISRIKKASVHKNGHKKAAAAPVAAAPVAAAPVAAAPAAASFLEMSNFADSEVEDGSFADSEVDMEEDAAPKKAPAKPAAKDAKAPAKGAAKGKDAKGKDAKAPAKGAAAKPGAAAAKPVVQPASTSGLVIQPAPGQAESAITVRRRDEVGGGPAFARAVAGQHTWEENLSALLAEADESEAKAKALKLRIVEKENFLASLDKRRNLIEGDIKADRDTVETLGAHIAAINSRVNRLKKERLAQELMAQQSRYSAAAKKLATEVENIRSVSEALSTRISKIDAEAKPLLADETTNMRKSLGAAAAAAAAEGAKAAPAKAAEGEGEKKKGHFMFAQADLEAGEEEAQQQQQEGEEEAQQEEVRPSRSLRRNRHVL